MILAFNLLNSSLSESSKSKGFARMGRDTECVLVSTVKKLALCNFIHHMEMYENKDFHRALFCSSVFVIKWSACVVLHAVKFFIDVLFIFSLAPGSMKKTIASCLGPEFFCLKILSNSTPRKLSASQMVLSFFLFRQILRYMSKWLRDRLVKATEIFGMIRVKVGDD